MLAVQVLSAEGTGGWPETAFTALQMWLARMNAVASLLAAAWREHRSMLERSWVRAALAAALLLGAATAAANV